MSKKLKIGVSGINAVDNPGPGVGVARSLKEDENLQVDIVGLAYDAMEPGIYMDWLIDKSYSMPYPSSGRDALINRLAYIKNDYGLDAVIPCLDSELPIYTKYRDAIEKLGIKLFIPTVEQFNLRNKDQLNSVAQNMGLSLPKTIKVTAPEMIQKAAEEIGFPLMVKGSYYKAYRANTLPQAMEYAIKISSEWGYPLLIQEVVNGEEMNVVGLGDGKGTSLGLVGLKKMWITSLGKIWTGVTIHHEAMLSAAEKFIANTKWEGPFELECMVDGDNVYLIEINPRFPAWSYFATGVGLNLPANLVRTLFNLPVDPNRDYLSGKLYVRYTYELITNMNAFQNMLTKGQSNE